MRKFIYCVLAVAIFSCSASDENSANEKTHPMEAYFLEAIIGSWAYDTVKINGQTFLYEHTEGCVKNLFQFYNSEGKLFDFEEHVVLNCPNCAECATSGTNLKWELKGDEIGLFWGDELVLVYKIKEVDEEKFIYEVEFDYDDDGVIDLLEFTNIPYDPYGQFD